MRNDSRKLMYVIIGGIVIAIATLIITTYGSQLLHPPQIVFVTAPNSAGFCPSRFTLPIGTGYFSVQLLNEGDNSGNVDLTISSSDIQFRVQNSNDHFESKTHLLYNVPSHSTTMTYTFELNSTNPVKPPTSIEIDTTMDCSYQVGRVVLNCGSVNNACKYVRDTSGFYNLLP